VKLPVFPFHTWFIDAQAEASARWRSSSRVLVKLAGTASSAVDVGEFQARSTTSPVWSS